MIVWYLLALQKKSKLNDIHVPCQHSVCRFIMCGYPCDADGSEELKH
jgi:hypothetical protein